MLLVSKISAQRGNWKETVADQEGKFRDTEHSLGKDGIYFFLDFNH